MLGGLPAAFAIEKNAKRELSFFLYRSPHSGQEPEGLKGGRPAGQMETVFGRYFRDLRWRKIQPKGKRNPGRCC
jgi:hypothetical protein